MFSSRTFVLTVSAAATLLLSSTSPATAQETLPACIMDGTGSCSLGSANYPSCFTASSNDTIAAHACLCTDPGYLNKLYSCAAKACSSDDFNAGVAYWYNNCQQFNVSYPAPAALLSSVSVSVPASISVTSSVKGFTATASAIESTKTTASAGASSASGSSVSSTASSASPSGSQNAAAHNGVFAGALAAVAVAGALAVL